MSDSRPNRCLARSGADRKGLSVIEFGLPDRGRIARRHSDRILVAELVGVRDVVLDAEPGADIL
jgi:hypothetical protein